MQTINPEKRPAMCIGPVGTNGVMDDFYLPLQVAMRLLTTDPRADLDESTRPVPTRTLERDDFTYQDAPAALFVQIGPGKHGDSLRYPASTIIVSHAQIPDGMGAIALFQQGDGNASLVYGDTVSQLKSESIGHGPSTYVRYPEMPIGACTDNPDGLFGSNQPLHISGVLLAALEQL